MLRFDFAIQRKLYGQGECVVNSQDSLIGDVLQE